MTTFAALKSSVLARLNMGTDDPVAGSVGDLVNEALHMVEVAHPAGWNYLHRTVTFTTTAGTSDYAFSSLSSTLAKVLSLRVNVNGSFIPLDVSSPEEAAVYYTDAAGTGEPSAYWVEGETIRIFPTPGGTYTASARVVRAEPDLVADSDSPLCPTRFSGAIIAAALVLYYETLQDSARSAAAGQRFDGWIGRMMTATRPMGGLPRVRVRESW